MNPLILFEANSMALMTAGEGGQRFLVPMPASM